jgi:hypothetical protein
MKLQRLLFLGGLIGGLFLPSVGWAQWGQAEDLFSVATHPLGAPRYSENIEGVNADIDTEESIWDVQAVQATGPARCFANMNSGTTPTAAALYISSSDAADAALGVTVEALDANWDPVTIAATLGADTGATGTEFVQLGSATLMRVNRAYATSTALTGDIYIHLDSVDAAAKDGIPDTIATDIVAVIDAGEDQTNMACYSVPNDYNAFVVDWCATNTTAAAVATFRERSSDEGAASQARVTLALPASVSECQTMGVPIRFPEKTDIEWTGVGTNGTGTATFNLVLISNSLSGL